MKLGLLDALKNDVLLGDGAMGTYLYHLGFPVGISYEELNLTRPEVIADVHRRYYEAGARVIETNTFTATGVKLAKFGLEQEAAAINRAAVKIARQAVGADAYVVGAVGSVQAGGRHLLEPDKLRREYAQQVNALLEEGVDAVLLETFFELREMRIALEAVRSLDKKIPVICQFAVEDVGMTLDGIPLADAFRHTLDEGGDVIGFNCRSGPNRMLRNLEKLPNLGAPVSVFPNAGIPDYVDGKYMYMATPEYFADSAVQFAALGVRLIGGCCGTTPKHIEAMRKALSGAAAERASTQPGQSAPDGSPERRDPQGAPVSPPQPRESVRVADRPGTGGSAEAEASGAGDAAEANARRWSLPPDEPTILDLVRERHTVIVELDPPRDLNIDKFMEGAAALKAAGADAVTMADNSLAMTRMSNLALGYLIKEKLGVRPLVHIACRDRNLIGTQSHMMGLHALGIRHVLAVTGDPARFGDLPGSSSVYDLTSFQMIRMIKQLNEGIAFSGKPLKERARFIVGAAFNPHVKYLDKAVRRLEKKVAAGADFIMTQPVYDPELIVRIHESTKHIGVPIFLGIAPLASGGNAEYLHNEVPGIQLSDEVRRRMAGLKGAEGRRMGVAIAKELLDVAMPLFNGIYLITPFLAYEMTVELTRYVREKVRIL